MKNAYRALLLAGCLGFFHASAIGVDRTHWDELTPAQQALLINAHKDHWNRMPAEAQQRMLKGAERWQKMSPEARARVHAQREKFRAMPPEDRRRMHERHEARRHAFKQLPPDQQQAIRDCWRRKKDGEEVDCRGMMPPPLQEQGGREPPPRD